jgi:hypothetical protein
MIGKTWRRATANQSPGIAQCNVALTDTNPIRGGGPVCYYRPNSEVDNDYYAILGVFNTNGMVSSSADIAGVAGVRHNDGWFEFNGSGRPVMHKNAQVTFQYESGSSIGFRLSDCQSGGQPHIFQ